MNDIVHAIVHIKPKSVTICVIQVKQKDTHLQLMNFPH